MVSIYNMTPAEAASFLSKFYRFLEGRGEIPRWICSETGSGMQRLLALYDFLPSDQRYFLNNKGILEKFEPQVIYDIAYRKIKEKIGGTALSIAFKLIEQQQILLRDASNDLSKPEELTSLQRLAMEVMTSANLMPLNVEASPEAQTSQDYMNQRNAGQPDATANVNPTEGNHISEYTVPNLQNDLVNVPQQTIPWKQLTEAMKQIETTLRDEDRKRYGYLKIFFFHPLGLSFLYELAYFPERAEEDIQKEIYSAQEAMDKFRKGFDGTFVWRCPQLIELAIQQEGLAQTDGFPEFCYDISKILGKTQLQRFVEVAMPWPIQAVMIMVSLIFTGPIALLYLAENILIGLAVDAHYEDIQEKQQVYVWGPASFRPPDTQFTIEGTSYYDERFAKTFWLCLGLGVLKAGARATTKSVKILRGKGQAPQSTAKAELETVPSKSKVEFTEQELAEQQRTQAAERRKAGEANRALEWKIAQQNWLYEKYGIAEWEGLTIQFDEATIIPKNTEPYRIVESGDKCILTRSLDRRLTTAEPMKAFKDTKPPPGWF
jgi:hypothetical protein